MTEVEQILTDKRIRFIPKGKDLLVVCFNPEHDDSNPSMRIDREDGKYHCFSCGHKGDLFYDFNRHRNVLTSKVTNLLTIIRELRQASGVSLPFDAFSFAHSFRGLKPETLIKFEAFTSEKVFPNRVVFPVKDANGLIIGMIGRYKDSNATPKYMIKPDSVSLPLSPPPQHIESIRSSVVLVEGIFDMLNLHDKGMKNALCTFGTTQINKDNVKEKLLPYMIQGVDTVYIMFDGDEAGRKAAKSLEATINFNTELLVEIIELGEGSDPGELSQTDVDSIKNYLLNK